MNGVFCKNPKKEIHALEPKRYNNLFYFERGIYDEENNSWGSQALHPTELTFFGIEGRFLVDSNGEPVFESNAPAAPTQVEVKMNAAEQLQDVASIATFSAPFNAVVPNGAKAWYVKQVADNKAQLTAVPEGCAIPAEQGVLLTTNSATDVLVMEQADASTFVAELTGNLLQANAQDDHVIAPNDNAYVLNTQQGQTAFYRAKVGTTLPRYKAYLQWSAKGLNFPNLRLVGVVLADTSLHLPDFRASERTFSLITQVAGRAGRFFPDGKVIVQSYSPDREPIALAAKGDTETFYKSELSQRELLGFPPFTRLLRLVFRSQVPNAAQTAAMAAASIIKSVSAPEEVEVLGPAECPLEMIAGNFRHQIILRGDRIAPLVDAAKKLVWGYTSPKNVYIEVDVDPVSML